MTVSAITATAIAAFGLASVGWMCLFKTSTVVRWARTNYARSKVTRAYPFSNLVEKTWYPTYLRCMGVFASLFAALLVSILINSAVQR